MFNKDIFRPAKTALGKLSTLTTLLRELPEDMSSDKGKRGGLESRNRGSNIKPREQLGHLEQQGKGHMRVVSTGG